MTVSMLVYDQSNVTLWHCEHRHYILRVQYAKARPSGKFSEPRRQNVKTCYAADEKCNSSRVIAVVIFQCFLVWQAVQHGHVTILPLPVTLVHELHCTVSLDFVPSRHRTKAKRHKSYKRTYAMCDVLNICQTGVAVQMPRRLLNASSSRTLGFGLRAAHVGTVVESGIRTDFFRWVDDVGTWGKRTTWKIQAERGWY